MNFSDIEYSNRKRKTKREDFLNKMEEIIPWDKWVKLIEPYYPTGKRGRPTKGIELMLRMYLMQNWFNLSDEGIEDAIYDSYAKRKFIGIDFISNQVPDATTLLKFRHLLEKNNIGEKIFTNVKESLEKAGLLMHGGTIVDATIISAPSSTKNKTGERDPEMRQTKKGNQWFYGMKVHAGVDAGTGYVHTVTGTSANVHDSREAHKLIREDDEVMFGDSGYLGVQNQKEITENEKLKDVKFVINKRPSSLKMAKNFKGINWDKRRERKKSLVRSKVEHIFLIVKNKFGYRKTVYRGIAKNMNRFHFLFASCNLVMCSRAGRVKEFSLAYLCPFADKTAKQELNQVWKHTKIR